MILTIACSFVNRYFNFFAILIFCLWLNAKDATAQDAPAEYNYFVKKADSLCHAGDYKNAAFAYSSAFSNFGWKGYQDDRYNAASAWAMAHNIDSAFYNLEKIVRKIGYSNYNKLSTDTTLFSLHKDKRWNSLLETVSINSVLDSMEKEDQKWRNMGTRIKNGEVDSISQEQAWKNAALTDSLNFPIIKNIFEKHGYVGGSLFWLLVQHADLHPDFQKAVLEKMEIEVDKGNASANDYAYLVDRVAVNTGEKQVYGTQMQLNEAGTSFEPRPCVDPEYLNVRRKRMQLSTIEEYIQGMNEHYHGALKHK